MKFLRRLRYFLNRDRQQRALAEELEFHREMSGDRSEFGNEMQAMEDARRVWIWPWLESIAQDAGYAIRNLKRQPGFAILAIAILGVTAGFNTAVFTLFNAVALRPWPVKDPGSVVKVEATSLRGYGNSGLSLPEYRYIARQAKSFAGLAAIAPSRASFGFEAFGERTGIAFVSANYLPLMGADAYLGRSGFLAQEDFAGSPQAVVVLSYSLWRDHFHSAAGIVGQTIRVENVPFTVVGVAAERFTGTSKEDEEAWFPLPAAPLMFAPDYWRNLLSNPGGCCADVVGRLAPGLERGRALAEIDVLSRQFRAPLRIEPMRLRLGNPTFLGDIPNGGPLVVIGLLFTGVTLLVILACANVGNLLLARAAARQREIEVRLSLGASRMRIIRQLLTESMVIALGAAAVGVYLGWQMPAIVFAMVADAGTKVPTLELTPDFRVLGYALMLAVLTCVAFGLAPALHATQRHFSASRLRLRSLLLSAQLAIGMVLLVSAGLLVEGVKQSQDRDLGFGYQNVSIASFQFPVEGYDRQRTQAFFSQLMNSTSGTVALTSLEPLADVAMRAVYRAPGETSERSGQLQQVSAAYFDVLAIEIVSGRGFSPQGAREEVVMNEAAALEWPGGNPVGAAMVIDGKSVNIVGIVRDANLSGSLGRVGAMMFRPIADADPGKMTALVRGPAESAALLLAASHIDPRVRVQMTPLARNVRSWLARTRIGPVIAGVVGVFALLLATAGMAGVFAFAVQQRTKEIGVRTALGARPADVVRLVLGTGSRAIVGGLAVGLAGSLAASRMLAGFLYGVSPVDPLAYLGTMALLTLAALTATYLPARRAARINPSIALRHE